MKEGPVGLVLLILGLIWNPSYEASHNEEEAANWLTWIIPRYSSKVHTSQWAWDPG